PCSTRWQRPSSTPATPLPTPPRATTARREDGSHSYHLLCARRSSVAPEV
ncbi:unnamed protein product, partial [Ectocarpus sp. 12 AP-2014]